MIGLLAGRRDGFGSFGRAARAVPSSVLQGMMAAALLCALVPAITQSLHAADGLVPPVADVAGPADDEAAAAVLSRCPGCGVVESIRALQPLAGSPAAYEFNVRMRDGSLRTSTTDGRAAWRVGDRILLVGGTAS